LPQIFFKSLQKDFPDADLLVVMGSSLVVQPFASLIGDALSQAWSPQSVVRHWFVKLSHEALGAI